jgi:hypothetical protein
MLQRSRRMPRREERRKRPGKPPKSGNASATHIFSAMAEASAAAYTRARDLTRLVALWPAELEDQSVEGRLRILAKLRRALRAERRRAVSGHWSYDLNRHIGLLSAYKGELAGLRAHRHETQPACARRDKGFTFG